MTISNKPTSLVSLVCDEITAKRVANLLGESLEAGETAVAAFEGTDGRWAVEVHFEESPDEALIRDLVTQAADAVTAAALVFDTVEARDWVATSLAGLKPVQAGRFTIHGQHDRAAVGPSRIGIEIEAALAFGTGHHGTTRGCLLALDALIKERRPRRILDIGTGTCVLAMAAAKALRQPVLATDIDPEAVRVARENTHLNGIAPLVTCLRAAGLTDGRIRARAPFDLIFANILLPPLKRLAHGIAGITAPDGRIVLSGLLATQEAAALAAYRAQGLSLIRRIPLDEWVTLVLARG